jgi:hypothetical protein
VTEGDPGEQAVTFVGRLVPACVRTCLFTIAPGRERPYVGAEWRDALVVVEAGTIELECVGGARPRFERGDILFLAGLPLRAIRNVGEAPALVSAVRRA